MIFFTTFTTVTTVNYFIFLNLLSQFFWKEQFDTFDNRCDVLRAAFCDSRDVFGEKHHRQTKKLKCSAPAEVVQPLPNLPAPAEVCPAPVSPAKVCSSWTQKSSRRRNFYTITASKST